MWPSKYDGHTVTGVHGTDGRTDGRARPVMWPSKYDGHSVTGVHGTDGRTDGRDP